MFYYAQKAVLHPTGPLYVLERQDVSNIMPVSSLDDIIYNRVIAMFLFTYLCVLQLTDECKKALTRIFKVG